MPWKTEIDRLVHHLVRDAAQGGPQDVKRATRAIADLAVLAPERPPTQFHAGALEEILGSRAEDESLAVLLEDLPAPGDDLGRRWRFVGRLDAAARQAGREHIHDLMDDPLFEESLAHPEGRVALRAVGRMLLREGAGDTVFDLYRRHLGTVDEEGSRRDAEFLLEESLRRVDRGDVTEEESLDRLQRAASFAEETNLAARARSKVDRKLGRVHQLAERSEEASGCYRRALDRLPEDDPYRSVLLGDLALTTLGVRGTLDVLPTPDRERREDAVKILESGEGGEGRSYNAIYTRGMLAYELDDWEGAAGYLREADQLMCDNRAKARIVHARSRFFLGRCLLGLGVEGTDLEEAERLILKNASAVSLDPEVKGVVFDVLREQRPGARIPGRGSSRGSRADATRPAAPQHLATARERLADDPNGALEYVDRAFKTRPDFETWFGAYRTRLDALLALGERDEALRTLERFRAKLYQRDEFESLEGFLKDPGGPAAALLDDADFHLNLADLYDVMPEREDDFREECLTCARACLESGEAERLARAVSLMREAAARDGEGAAESLEEATEVARSAGALEAEVSREEIEDLLQGEEEPIRLVVVGGGKGHQRQVERFRALAQEMGFEGDWIFTGVKPPYKTLREIAGAAQDSDVILLHHALGPDMRREVKSLGERHDVPVREATWLGSTGIESEVLRGLRDAFVE